MSEDFVYEGQESRLQRRGAKPVNARAARSARVWDILVSEGKLSLEDLLKARAAKGNEDLATTLVSMGLVTPEDVALARAKRLGLRYERLDPKSVASEALALLPERVMRRCGALPLRLEGERLVAAMSDPSNIYAVEDLRVISGRPISPVVATPEDIKKTLDEVFDQEDKVRDEVLAEAGPPEKSETRDSQTLAESSPNDAPVVRLFDSVLRRAIVQGASDIHVEPLPGRLVIRYRIDGVLREVMEVPARLASGLVTRVKVMADLDIAERRRPQDGRFSVESGERKIDLRAASLPTVHGESVVLRLLDAASLEVDFERLGFPKRDLEKYGEIFRRPYGTILATGPTGSGKSTTLYATLSALNSPAKKIITIEDPVEYRLPGLNQIQVNLRAGLNFASGLRSILRADPDIVMIGEVRDPETARTAVEAALTGHLVLATLHTNDAPSALTRIADMGVEPFLSASAVDCVIAQRLARKLCESCKLPVEVSEETLRALEFPFEIYSEPEFFEAAGCESCGETGYRGRIGLFEMMEVSEEIKDLVIDRASSTALGRAAERAGMFRLREDGLLKAASGVTSIEEVLRTVV